MSAITAAKGSASSWENVSGSYTMEENKAFFVQFEDKRLDQISTDDIKAKFTAAGSSKSTSLIAVDAKDGTAFYSIVEGAGSALTVTSLDIKLVGTQDLTTTDLTIA